MVAAIRRGPHWQLSDEEAKGFARAIANCLRHTSINVAQKYVDFVALGIAVLNYEGPRVMMDIQLRGAARQPQRPSATVHPFTPRPAGPPSGMSQSEPAGDVPPVASPASPAGAIVLDPTEIEA